MRASLRFFSARRAALSFWVSWSLRRRVWKASGVRLGFLGGTMFCTAC